MKEPRIAYFTMEIHLEDDVPTYSGGLGVLAGDTTRSAADLELPQVAVSLLYRKGYLHQNIDDEGRQRGTEAPWNPEEVLEELPQRVTVSVEERKVQLRCFRYPVRGVSGHVVPVLLLDSDLPENSEWDRALTDRLYGGEEWYRICQEIVLGLGGLAMLRALGYDKIQTFHMNEGHAALLTLGLLQENADASGRTEIIGADIEAVRERCVFTTHTPVPAGHDQFPLALVKQALGEHNIVIDMQDEFCVDVQERVLRGGDVDPEIVERAEKGTRLNMTYLALNLSNYVNGVAKKHGEVSRMMFAGYPIDAITNGVHAATWVAPPMQELFDRWIHEWRRDNTMLRYALTLPDEEIWDAHQSAKSELFERVKADKGVEMDPEIFTVGFARRAATYKRADLIFSDLDRLRALGQNHGGMQLVFAGKAHPRDEAGKDIIQRIIGAAPDLAPHVKLVFLENYQGDLGRLLTAGTDLWLNTPKPPNEASGTSGMKAALNGVPSLSTLDGWWLEGWIDGMTGWAIGSVDDDSDDRMHADSIYEQLALHILPLYYSDRAGFISVMRNAIGINGSFFNTERMVHQYAVRAYLS